MLPFGDRIGRKATGGLYGYLVLKEWQKGRHLPFAAIVNNEKERGKNGKTSEWTNCYITMNGKEKATVP